MNDETSSPMNKVRFTVKILQRLPPGNLRVNVLNNNSNNNNCPTRNDIVNEMSGFGVPE